MTTKQRVCVVSTFYHRLEIRDPSGSTSIPQMEAIFVQARANLQLGVTLQPR